MAFTTEFVMGAGGAGVEEIPVSMSGSQVDNLLATVDAGSGAWVWVDGEKTGPPTMSLSVGGKEYHIANNERRTGGGGHFTSTVEVSIRNTTFGSATFTGTVYVTRT